MANLYSAEMSPPIEIRENKLLFLQLVDVKSYPVYSSYAPCSNPKPRYSSRILAERDLGQLSDG